MGLVFLPAALSAQVCNESVQILLQQPDNSDNLSKHATDLAKKNVSGRMVSAAKSSLVSAVTGATPSGGSIVSETTENFLSDFNFSNIFNSDAESGDVTLELPIRGIGTGTPDDDLNADAKIKLTAAGTASPYGAILTEVPENVRDQVKALLGANLSRTDDLTLSLAYTFESTDAQIGRDFHLYRNQVETEVNKVLSNHAKEEMRQIRLRVIELNERVSKAASFLNEDQEERIAEGDIPLWAMVLANPDLSIEKRADVTNLQCQKEKNRIITYLTGITNLELRLTERSKQASLGRIGNLINNQPQLNFLIEHNARNNIAGPDSWSIEAAYEMGFGNWSSFQKWVGSANQSDALLAEYISAHEKQIAAEHRLKFSLKYNYQDQYQFSIPPGEFLPGGLEYHSNANDQWSATMAYSRYLGSAEPDERRTKFTFAIAYEQASSLQSNDRGVASATFSIPVRDEFTIPIGITYATEPEFLGDVQAELSANVGFTWSFDNSN